MVTACSEHGPALLQSPGTQAAVEGVLENKVETAVAYVTGQMGNPKRQILTTKSIASQGLNATV